MEPQLAEAALANASLSEVVVQSAAQQMKNLKMDTGARGVGKYENDSWTQGEADEDGDGFLSEERLMEIAMQVSMLEQ